MINLKEILDYLKHKKIYGRTDLIVEGITNDSRQVKENFIFVCIKGEKENGEKYISSALSNGATVIVTERKMDIGDITLIITPDARYSLAVLSSAFYKDPSRKLKMIGVTGTNGKTTTTYFLESIFSANKNKAGVLGTVSYRLGNKIIPSFTTTPSSVELQKILAKMVEDNFDIAVMEVSSHALMQQRVVNCEYDIAIFTNLTPDHLNYHRTMEEYLKAKTKLFTELGKNSRKKGQKFAIINNDDKACEYIMKHTTVSIISYGIENKGDFFAKRIEFNLNYTSFILCTPQGEISITLNLIGLHNVYNALASSAAAQTMGISIDKIKKGLESLKFVPGRFEVISEGQNFTCVVDFAHSPDALERTIQTARHLNPKRIITVFGCGGDRDRSKRPLMGEIAAKNSDFVWITSDNPRSENPMKIVTDIEVGIKRIDFTNYRVVLDRRKAIKEALDYATENDFVLIAGKGHETCQILAAIIPFDERKIVRDMLKEKNKGKK